MSGKMSVSGVKSYANMLLDLVGVFSQGCMQAYGMIPGELYHLEVERVQNQGEAPRSGLSNF